MNKVINFILKRKKIFLPLILVLLLIIIFYLYQAGLKLKIITTLPQNNQNEIPLDSKIVLIFNKKTKAKNLSISINPDFDYSIEENNEKITIIPKTKLIENSKYSLDLKMKNFQHSFSFVTQKITGEASEQTFLERGEPNFYQEARNIYLKDYPLFDFIPFKTEQYSIDYVKPLTLEITSELPKEKISSEVEKWITSKGVNPKTHVIQYK